MCQDRQLTHDQDVNVFSAGKVKYGICSISTLQTHTRSFMVLNRTSRSICKYRYLLGIPIIPVQRQDLSGDQNSSSNGCERAKCCWGAILHFGKAGQWSDVLKLAVVRSVRLKWVQAAWAPPVQWWCGDTSPVRWKAGAEWALRHPTCPYPCRDSRGQHRACPTRSESHPPPHPFASAPCRRFPGFCAL